ncbi:MazG-like family protein [Paenibacillus kobensis]|uniref:MazG-like family protein n=1 Tax=Paenibacillus kobensis TaxID=59841 RepID=UPI000FD7B8A7|nr:MazG-like family protein [Paenibacillus kobensis]
MRGADREFDVARRVQTIEWLKTEIVDHVSRLFKSLLEGSDPKIADSLAGLAASSYMLGQRLGVSYRQLDQAMIEKLRQLARDGHALEDAYQIRKR